MKASYLGLVCVYFCALNSSLASESAPALVSNSRLNNSQIGSIRMRNFVEFMSPGLSRSESSVPHYAGGPLVPAFLSGIFWTDYEFATDLKLLYFQKYTLDFSGASTPSGVGGRFLDPRFAVRASQVFKVTGMDTDYDLFVQPGVTAGFMPQPGRSFDVGIRTNTQYSIPASRFSVGAIAELTTTFYSEASQGADLSGLFVPWVSYQLSQKFFTQHYVVAPFKHRQGDRLDDLRWDITGMPYVQNGVGVSVGESTFVAVLLNNYLLTTPTLENTWASLWVSIKFM